MVVSEKGIVGWISGPSEFEEKKRKQKNDDKGLA